MTSYRVRQHIPNFVTGGDPPKEVEVEADDIANPDKAPWMKHYRDQEGFVEFFTQPYYDDGALLVSARYNDGKSWVCSVATPIIAERTPLPTVEQMAAIVTEAATMLSHAGVNFVIIAGPSEANGQIWGGSVMSNVSPDQTVNLVRSVIGIVDDPNFSPRELDLGKTQ